MIDRATVWTPRVTVASILECEGRFLLVEESIGGRLVLNQPAGHLEDGEGLLAAVVRETREETAWAFIPEALVGVYRWRTRDKTFLRFVFCGRTDGHDPHQLLDPEINRALWLSWEELRTGHYAMRSPLVLRSLQDYRDGRRFPLEIVQDVSD